MQYLSHCPICKSKNTAPISYGYPTPEAVEDSKKRDVHFGGYVIDIFNQNNRYCNDC